MYYSPGLEITGLVQLSFHEGVGDHRTVIVDISSRSMIGVDSFKIVRPPARRLAVTNRKSTQRYFEILEQKFTDHNLFTRLEECKRDLSQNASDSNAAARLEMIDVESPSCNFMRNGNAGRSIKATWNSVYQSAIGSGNDGATKDSSTSLTRNA